MISSFSNLSARERTLAIIVGGAILVLINLVALNIFFKNARSMRAQLATQTTNWQAQQELLKQRDFWAQRDQWVRSKQPVLTNPATAGGELLTKIQKLAQEHGVTLESPAFNPVTPGAWHQSVSVTMQTTSSWADLMAFFIALQQPENFMVPESTDVKIDPSDNTKMRAQLRIAKWYAL